MSLLRPWDKNKRALTQADTNIAPDKELLQHMVVTPMETLVHGVDEETRRNIETFWRLGYA